jgi:hypothetical protein
MAGTTKEIVIKTKMEEVVARVNVKDAVLHGHSEWYDGRGNLIVYGFFEDGHPLTGTFLNWAKFLTQFNKENPYDAALYCQDWVTIFEACFLSELPKYEMVVEAFYKGTKISL